MILGHLFGLMNAMMPMGVIGKVLIWIVCGAGSAIGSILLPMLVAPSHKKTVGIISFWCQVVVFIVSIVCTIILSTIQGQELLKYVISMIGCAGGIVYSKQNMIEDLCNGE